MIPKSGPDLEATRDDEVMYYSDNDKSLTSGILKKFINEIENLKNLKVKIIRCDNEGEFRNKEINDFCSQKGIKREFSNARTPQQNGVAERRNRTLIEAARTMLVDAKIPVTFWAEAVNTACYVQNRVLVNKSHNKTPYELFNGKSPAIGLLKPFGYHVMILNTLDNLGKFKEKGDDGYFIRYSMSSKAFRVFNKRTRRVEENLHVEFLENKAIEKGVGPNWLFDIDSLTKSMNYMPVDAGTNSTNISGTKDATSQEVKKNVSSLRYIALPNWDHDALLEYSSSKPQDHCSTKVPEGSGNPNPTASTSNPSADQMETLTVETPISTEEGIDYDEVFAPVAQIEAIRLFLAYASFMGFTVYQMDVKSSFLYGIIDEEVYVMQPLGFQDLEFPAKVYKVEKAMYGLHQAPRAWYVYVDDIIFGSSNPQLCKEFEALMHEKFQMSAMGELNFFLGLKVLQKENDIFLSQDKLSMPCEDLSREVSSSILRFNTIMARLQFYDYHNMVAILEKSEHNVNFHPMVDFIESSPLRIETTDEGTQILATIDGVLRTVTESSLRINLKFKDEEGISSLPDIEFFENLTLMGYNISPNQNSNIATALVCLATNRTYNFSKMIFDGLVKNVNNKGEGSDTSTEPHHTPSPVAQPTSHTTHSSSTLPPVTTTFIPTVTPSKTTPIRQYTRRARISQSSALPTDRETIAKSSTLPHDLAPRVTSPAADEGSMQQTINELTTLCTSLQRQYSELAVKFEAQEIKTTRLKARVKLLEDRTRGAAEGSKDDAPIKGRNLDEGETTAERVSDDTEEMATVLTSIDATTVLASGTAEVPTGSGSIPTTGPPTAEVPTSSDVVPNVGPVFAIATVVTPYRRRKGKEVMVESDTPKKHKVQEQIDAHVARELEEQLEREDQRRNNETIAKYLQEYHQFASELPIERRIELISDLVKYQDNYPKIYKFQSQQRKPWTKKQKRDYYMAVIRSNLGWKVKDFRGMTFKEVEAKFNLVWKQMEDFIPMGSKEEAERIKRKGLSLE
uniref:Ribonuclease H-like domain-containing protein n=1 Tax=Tanacetum cinerariifolium TaxID=118510 RepID=A0A699HNY2_TANCI|nr:ribonuclease H-like domain-containing protein [Tanacetum cinerariifolium]